MAARSASPAGLRQRGGRVTSISALAFGVLLFLLSAGISAGALTPKLVVSSVQTAKSQTLTITASKPMADDAVGRVQFYVPTGYPLNSPAGGVSVGTATAQAVLRDVDPAHEQGLKGSIIAIGPSDASVAYEASTCDGNTHLAAWMVQLTGAKGTLAQLPGLRRRAEYVRALCPHRVLPAGRPSRRYAPTARRSARSSTRSPSR